MESNYISHFRMFQIGTGWGPDGFGADSSWVMGQVPDEVGTDSGNVRDVLHPRPGRQNGKHIIFLLPPPLKHIWALLAVFKRFWMLLSIYSAGK